MPDELPPGDVLHPVLDVLEKVDPQTTADKSYGSGSILEALLDRKERRYFEKE